MLDNTEKNLWLTDPVWPLPNDSRTEDGLP